MYINNKFENKVYEIFIFKCYKDNFGFLICNDFFNNQLFIRCTITYIYDIINYKKIVKYFGRYFMNSLKKVDIEEENKSFSNDDLFNINSWGADLSFRELIAMYDDEDLVKPALQRKYIWKIDEASRLIDSILLGLPIPSRFLAKKDEKRLIIDGYQRIKTVYDYVNGIFTKNNKVFKLSNSQIINERWRGKTFKELSEDEQRRIKNTTIHAIIFEQRKPNNDSGMYQIFERINTSGRTLCPQEIRNCIYHGTYNKLLMELNKNETWRKILGCDEEPRMIDVEYILRYFAMKDIKNTSDFNKNQIILRKFLNENMARYCDMSLEKCDKYKENFTTIISKIYETLGETAFNNISYKYDENDEYVYSNQFVNKFHPTIYESIMLAFDYAIRQNAEFSNLKKKQLDLLNDPDFKEAIAIRTTNIENIKKRISLATKYLFGIEYEWE